MVKNLILKTQNSIKIGVLHSLTGTMAISESSIVDAGRRPPNNTFFPSGSLVT